MYEQPRRETGKQAFRQFGERQRNGSISACTPRFPVSRLPGHDWLYTILLSAHFCQSTSGSWDCRRTLDRAFRLQKMMLNRSWTIDFSLNTTFAHFVVVSRASCRHTHALHNVRMSLDSLCDALLTSSIGIRHCPCSPRPKKLTGANSRTFPDTMCISISLSDYGRPGTPICRTMSWPQASCPS